jgi:hypothetical protein
MSKTINFEADIDGKKEKINGRFIGFIRDDEFNALIQNADEVGTKLESKATQDIMKVAGKFDNLTGHRMAVVLKKIGNKSVLSKMLWVSESLAMIDSVVPRQEKGKWDQEKKEWVPAPGKVTIQTGAENNLTVEEAE